MVSERQRLPKLGRSRQSSTALVVVLKHPHRAYDYNWANNNGLLMDGVAPSIVRWKDHVVSVYGDAEDGTLSLAYSEIIVKEYASRYNETVDGWWFDQGSYLVGDGFDHTKTIHDIIMQYNPNATLAFNRGPKRPLQVNSPGSEHFTAGHPEPLKNANPPDEINIAMVESVEGTPDGFVTDENGNSSLCHLFMPVSDSWNTVNSPIGIWPVSRAAEWKDRVLHAGGAWTWNLPRESNNAASLSLLDVDQVNFIKQVEATIHAPSLAPSTSVSPTTSLPPSLAPSMSAGPSTAPSQSSAPSTSPSASLAPTSASTEPDELPSELKVTILTDYYGHETSWEITDDCNNGATVLRGGPYLPTPGQRRRNRGAWSSPYTAIATLPQSQYSFHIRDSYGDGLCCSYGDGSYSVSYDNVTVASGGDFDSLETHTFGVCNDALHNSRR